MFRRSSYPTLSLLAALLALGSAGCKSCKNDHPYVPPSPSSEPPTVTSADASAPTLTEERADAGIEPALVAPPETTTWRVEGVELSMPGREIILALVRDFDGDGKKDALAIVRPPAADLKPESTTGELVFFHGGDNAPAGVVASGPNLTVQPSCAPTARLERIGPRSVFAEIGTTCTRGAGSRGIFVVRLPSPSIAFDAVVVDPAAAPKLTIDVDAADRDKDNIDDLVLHATIEGASPPFEPGPRTAAKLAFFDRPAGPSRDPEEPEASLKTIALSAARSAGKPKEAASVPGLVQQMRALYRAMCLEGGAPRITKVHGATAASCGHQKALEDAGVAEVKSWVTQGDALRAFAAAEIAQLPPATKTAKQTTEINSLLAQVAPTVDAKSVRTLNATFDAPRGHHPEWGSLAFDTNGKLLVRHGTKVAQLDPDRGEEETTEVLPWPSQVVSPDGKSRWLEAYHACEGVALRATFAPMGDGDMHDVLLPIAPRLGKTCTGGRGEAARVIPIAWSQRGLEAIVANQPVLITLGSSSAIPLANLTNEQPPQGSPRSPGGRSVAIPIAQGILVKSDKWSLYKSPDLQPYTSLDACTVTDDATHVACIKKNKVVVSTF